MQKNLYIYYAEFNEPKQKKGNVSIYWTAPPTGPHLETLNTVHSQMEAFGEKYPTGHSILELNHVSEQPFKKSCFQFDLPLKEQDKMMLLEYLTLASHVANLHEFDPHFDTKAQHLLKPFIYSNSGIQLSPHKGFANDFSKASSEEFVDSFNADNPLYISYSILHNNSQDESRFEDFVQSKHSVFLDQYTREHNVSKINVDDKGQSMTLNFPQLDKGFPELIADNFLDYDLQFTLDRSNENASSLDVEKSPMSFVLLHQIAKSHGYSLSFENKDMELYYRESVDAFLPHTEPLYDKLKGLEDHYEKHVATKKLKNPYAV